MDPFLFPASFAQQRLWFLEQLAAGNSTYNMIGGVGLSGQLDMVALERTINEIVSRHEILRTTFVNIDGRPLQVVAGSRPLTVDPLDLRTLPASEHDAAIEQLASEELRHTFDLSKGRLLRVKLLRLGEDKHVALVAMHHIISDGLSIGIFLREVEELYAAYTRHGLSKEEWFGPRYYRLRVIKGLIEEGKLDTNLRRVAPKAASS